jgi:hypothetical protein
MSRAKKYYNATLCYLASLHLFWRGFLFVRWVQLLYFFSCLLKKYKCCRVWATKTMTKKWRATTQSSPPLGLLAVPCGVGLGAFGEEDFMAQFYLMGSKVIFD